MGRRTEIDNDDNEHQSASSSLSIEMTHESQINSNRNSSDDKLYDDPLIHDTILPHRKRLRRDNLLSIQRQHYAQPPQSEPIATCYTIDTVSLFQFIFYSIS